MRILVKDTMIISYGIVGGFEGDIEIDDSIVPDIFIDDFAPEKFLYVNNEIIENPGYVPPEPPAPVAPIEERVSELEVQNQMLTDCILEMSEIIYGE